MTTTETENNWKLYTGPTITTAIAKKLMEADVDVTFIGTEHIYIQTDKTAAYVLKVLGPTFKPQSLQESKYCFRQNCSCKLTGIGE